MADCTSLLGTAINGSCPAPVRGYEQVGYIANIDDIVSASFDVDTGICDNITMVAEKTFFPITIRSKNPFDGTKGTGIEKKYGYYFDTEFEALVIGSNPANAAIVNQLSKGRFVVVLPQVGKVTNEDKGKYQVIGIEAGLEGSGFTYEPYGDNGGWSCMLKEELAQSSMMFLYDTDTLTTDTLFGTLIP